MFLSSGGGRLAEVQLNTSGPVKSGAERHRGGEENNRITSSYLEDFLLILSSLLQRKDSIFRESLGRDNERNIFYSPLQHKDLEFLTLGQQRGH